MFMQIDPSYERYREPDHTVVVRLYKALYGCVEASLFWYNDLKSKLTADSFVENPNDRCVFNKIGKSGKQILIVLHVEDLMVTSENQRSRYFWARKRVYPETRTTSGTILDYVGMTFEFTMMVKRESPWTSALMTSWRDAR